jgi:hypothetical protein
MTQIAITGYEMYLVSSEGAVTNTRTGRVLKAETTFYGYARITVSFEGKIKRFSVHRLVAEHFVPNPDNKPVVNHLDGVKLNNSASNLEWCTHSENHQHAYLHGLSRKGSERSSALLDEEAVHKVCQMFCEGIPRGQILAAGIHPELKKHMVDNIRRRRTWKHVSKYYTWEGSTTIPKGSTSGA